MFPLRVTFPFTLYKHLICIHIHKYLPNTLLLEAALIVGPTEPWRGTSCTRLHLGLLFFLCFFFPSRRSSKIALNLRQTQIEDSRTQIQTIGDKQEVEIRPAIFLFQFSKLWLSGWFVLKATRFGCVL